MKKFVIFFCIIIAILAIFWINYNNYKINHNRILSENFEYEELYNQEIYGTDLTTVINKVINNNEKNDVEKNSSQKYINNDTNSINIDIKMLDTEKTYSMEILYNGGIEKFVEYYGNIKFKCKKIEYHKSTGKVKYLYFEQITQ